MEVGVGGSTKETGGAKRRIDNVKLEATEGEQQRGACAVTGC